MQSLKTNEPKMKMWNLTTYNMTCAFEMFAIVKIYITYQVIFRCNTNLSKCPELKSSRV